jgi:sugar phosphate isomerase/epimerase
MISLCTGTRCREHLWTFDPDTASDGAWNDMMEVARDLADIARRHGARLAVETEASNVVSTPERARRMIDELGGDVACAIMDCANLFHAGEARRERVAATIEHAFDVLGGDLALAHAKDILESDGLRFCAAGDGIVDFDLFLMLLAKYGYDGDMILHGAYRSDAIARAATFLRGRIAAAQIWA